MKLRRLLTVLDDELVVVVVGVLVVVVFVFVFLLLLDVRPSKLEKFDCHRNNGTDGCCFCGNDDDAVRDNDVCEWDGGDGWNVTSCGL